MATHGVSFAGLRKGSFEPKRCNVLERPSSPGECRKEPHEAGQARQRETRGDGRGGRFGV